MHLYFDIFLVTRTPNLHLCHCFMVLQLTYWSGFCFSWKLILWLLTYTINIPAAIHKQVSKFQASLPKNGRMHKWKGSYACTYNSFWRMRGVHCIMQEKYCKKQPKILSIFSIFNSLELLKIIFFKKIYLTTMCQSNLQSETTQYNQAHLGNRIPLARLVFQLVFYLCV